MTESRGTGANLILREGNPPPSGAGPGGGPWGPRKARVWSGAAAAGRRGGGEPAGGAPEGAREPLGAPTKRGGAREGAPGPGRTYRLMVRSRVRGLVCWMYLLPNWLTPRGQPVCERLGGTTDMLASSSTGGEKKRGGQGDFPCAGSGYLRPPQQPPPAINRRAQEEAKARRKCIRSLWRQEVERRWPACLSATGPIADEMAAISGASIGKSRMGSTSSYFYNSYWAALGNTGNGHSGNCSQLREVAASSVWRGSGA